MQDCGGLDRRARRIASHERIQLVKQCSRDCNGRRDTVFLSNVSEGKRDFATEVARDPVRRVRRRERALNVRPRPEPRLQPDGEQLLVKTGGKFRHGVER